ncbi:MAG: YbhN family protein [Acidimicrobiales bacterium]
MLQPRSGVASPTGDHPRRSVFFAAPSDDPRSRRTADAAVATVCWLLLLLFAWSYRVGSDVDDSVGGLLERGVPGWIDGIATIVYAFGGIYGLGLLIGIGVFGGGRLAIARDMVFAAALALAGLIGLALLAGPEFPDFLPEVLDTEGTPSFPVARLAVVMAMIRVSHSYLTVPMRNVGRRTVAAMAVAAVVLSVGTVTGALGGLLLGLAASSTVQFVLGSGKGIPSRDRIEEGLREAGLEVERIEFLPDQHTGATQVRAVRSDGGDLLVKVYGRDAADAALAARLWRSIWYRSETRPLLATNEQLAEHESLMLLTCARFGIPMAELVGWSRATTDDMLVITEWVEGTTLHDLATTDPATTDPATTDVDAGSALVDDALIDRVWSALVALHAAGITHSQIDGRGILVADGDAMFADVSHANILSSADQIHADRAQMLVTTALAVGPERAIEAAERSLGDDDLAATLPFVQAPALTRALQRDVRASGLDVDELRNGAAARLGTEAPEMEQLHRVSWGNVAMVALTLFAASTLITSLTELGLETIASEIGSAAWGWVVVAFILAQLTNVGEYVTLVGVMGRPAPFGPTIVFRYALSFVSLAVPSEAGAIAMNVRYQQRLGVPSAAAITQGPLISVISRGFDLILLAITAPIVGSSVDTDDLDFGAAGKLLVAVVVIGALAILAFALVPKLRAMALPHIREGFHAVKGSITDPERLFRVAGGTLLQKVLFAMTMSAAVAAYGGSLGFAEAIFVNTAVSFFVSLVPVPGGIGVAETAITAGLVSVGVPEETAVAAAITHRMVTAYIPPVFGWFASRWLTARRYL